MYRSILPSVCVPGTGCCLWFLLWILLAYSTPEQHPWISQQELQYIQQTTGRPHPVPVRCLDKYLSNGCIMTTIYYLLELT